MSERRAILFIEDIFSSIERIEKYCSGVETYEEFSRNDMLVDAVLRNLEIIGEAAKYIPEDLKEKYNDIPWNRVVGLRNIVS